MPNEDLKKLPPEERIKRLKKLEEERKKEIDDARKQIQESEQELTERQKVKDKVPIPQVARENLEGLTREEREILKVHKGLKEKRGEDREGREGEGGKETGKTFQRGEETTSLEEAVAKGRMELPPQLLQSQYAIQLSKSPIQALYQEMREIRETAVDKGYLNAEEQRKVTYLSSAVERKLEDVEAGRYSLTEEVARTALLTAQIGSDLRSMYKGREGKDRKNEWYTGTTG
ncbi:hypothetical protein HYX14_02885 [Candidatus Woesearchaeota archaeon]|nr:hypothetical protein [Candidatus Woesearchaeota archaeon]